MNGAWKSFKNISLTFWCTIIKTSSMAIYDSVQQSIVLSKSKLVKAWRKLALLWQRLDYSNVVSLDDDDGQIFCFSHKPCPSFIQTGNRCKPHVLQEPLLFHGGGIHQLFSPKWISYIYSFTRERGSWTEILNTNPDGRNFHLNQTDTKLYVMVKRSSSLGSE